jgi:HEAT repeat protein
LLGDAPRADVVDAVAPFLSDPADEIRKDAALIISKSGGENIVPLVRKAFADSEQYVRSYALMGLEFARKRNGLSRDAAEQLRPDIKQLLKEADTYDKALIFGSKAAELLFRLAPEEAKTFFLSPDIFSAGLPILHHVLKVLANAKASVPRKDLLALIAVLESQNKDAWALGEALRLLGQHGLEEDRDFLKARALAPEKRLARGAAAGLLCSYGLDGFRERIRDAEKKHGYNSLPDHQRYYSAVFMCDAEVNNGG